MKNQYLNIAFLLLVFAGCANVQDPDGGPQDKTPPIIEAYTPPNGTINFKGKFISLEFSKYMDNSKVNENVFISPTRQLSYDWSGKELEIGFLEPLDSNRTYAITLGTEYTDRKGNKPTDAFILIFSTGNKIDSGSIKGRLIDDRPAGVYVFGYLLNGMNPDTLNPLHTKPEYRTQVGSSGNFELRALKPGKYRLFAVRDKGNDGGLDEGSDDFGAAVRDLSLDSNSSEVALLKIGHPIDRTGPMLFTAEPLSAKVLEANFSEPIDSSSINNISFSLSDSTGKKQVSVLAAYISLKSANTAEIILAERLDTTLKWKLTAKNIVKDTTGNNIQDTANFAYFFPLGSVDTLATQLIKTPFADSSQGIDITRNFSFIFRTALINNDLNSRFKLIKTDDKKEVPFTISSNLGNIITLIPSEKLISMSKYELSFRLDSLKSGLGAPIKDSTLKLSFTTRDLRNYGGASGKLSGLCEDSNKTKNKYVTFVLEAAPKTRYTAKVDALGKWEINDLPAGVYTAEAFCDIDGNGTYSYGSAYPFLPSEPMKQFDKKIEIKPRWKIEDIILR